MIFHYGLEAWWNVNNVDILQRLQKWYGCESEKDSGSIGRGLACTFRIMSGASCSWILSRWQFLINCVNKSPSAVWGSSFLEEIHRTSFSIGHCMKRGNKETLSGIDTSACSVNQLITADNTDNTWWELSTLHCIHKTWIWTSVPQFWIFELCCMCRVLSMFLALQIAHLTQNCKRKCFNLNLWYQQEMWSLFY